jgi:hypothetical protein
MLRRAASRPFSGSSTMRLESGVDDFGDGCRRHVNGGGFARDRDGLGEVA